jgi:hypothetical protein
MSRIKTEIGEHHAGSGIDKPAHGVVSGLMQKVKDAVKPLPRTEITVPEASPDTITLPH